MVQELNCILSSVGSHADFLSACRSITTLSGCKVHGPLVVLSKGAMMSRLTFKSCSSFVTRIPKSGIVFRLPLNKAVNIDSQMYSGVLGLQV